MTVRPEVPVSIVKHWTGGGGVCTRVADLPSDCGRECACGQEAKRTSIEQQTQQ